MKKIVILFSVVLLASCAPKLHNPSEADAKRGATKFPGLTVDDLNKGKAIFNDKCTQCHDAKRPTSWTEAQWRKIVPVMAAKAKEHGKRVVSAEEQEAILKYVLTMGPNRK